MTNGRSREPQSGSDAVSGPEDVLQIHLEEVGRHSWKGALLSAVVGAGGGPLYRFVAAAPDAAHADTDHAAVGAQFPLMPFGDLADQTDDEWTTLARKRLHELDAELESTGWRRLPERGRHWWSLRYAHGSG